jgi:hypothetical protein
MRIPIVSANDEHIAAALADVSGKALKHAATATDVCCVVERAERQLDTDKLPHNRRRGIAAVWCAAGADAKAYRYAMTRTRLVIERGHRTRRWYLIEVGRAKVYPQQAEKLDIHISPDQAGWIARRALRAYSVRRRERRRKPQNSNQKRSATLNRTEVRSDVDVIRQSKP